MAAVGRDLGDVAVGAVTRSDAVGWDAVERALGRRWVVDGGTADDDSRTGRIDDDVVGGLIARRAVQRGPEQCRRPGRRCAEARHPSHRTVDRHRVNPQQCAGGGREIARACETAEGHERRISRVDGDSVARLDVLVAAHVGRVTQVGSAPAVRHQPGEECFPVTGECRGISGARSGGVSGSGRRDDRLAGEVDRSVAADDHVEHEVVDVATEERRIRQLCTCRIEPRDEDVAAALGPVVGADRGGEVGRVGGARDDRVAGRVVARSRHVVDAGDRIAGEVARHQRPAAGRVEPEHVPVVVAEVERTRWIARRGGVERAGRDREVLRVGVTDHQRVAAGVDGDVRHAVRARTAEVGGVHERVAGARDSGDERASGCTQATRCGELGRSRPATDDDVAAAVVDRGHPTQRLVATAPDERRPFDSRVDDERQRRIVSGDESPYRSSSISRNALVTGWCSPLGNTFQATGGV